MFSKYKRKLLLNRITKNLRKRKRSQINAPMQTIGFLVDGAVIPYLETFKKLASSLGVKDRYQFYLMVLPYEKDMPALRSTQMNNKQIKWNGRISNASAMQFLQKDIDVLIGCYNGPHLQFDYLISTSEAKFKVGLKGAESHLFDLLLDVPLSEPKLIEKELSKYLKILGKI